MHRFSVGFLMIPNDTTMAGQTTVLLIRKNRPEWQAGLLNGVGGHVEEGETFHDCMVREFQEETGMLVPEWDGFLTLNFPDAEIVFFRAFVDYDTFWTFKTMTDEHVTPYSVGFVDEEHLIPNLTWILPLAAYTRDTYAHIDVDVTSWGNDG